ncbi:MAG TPA: alpha/beta hydrolase [Candidatus Paceibacterota bacterium]
MEGWKIINGGNAKFLELGAGKPLLILHGWNSSLSSWKETAISLAENGNRVIVPDMPGFGSSDAPDRPWTTDDYTKWVLDLIRELNLKNINLAGHSFGGGLAIKLAVQRPELFEKLVLISTARIRKKKSLHRSIIKVGAKIIKFFSFLPLYEKARSLLYRKIVGTADYPRASGTMKDTFKNVIAEDLTPVISLINLPTIIIWGDKDRLTEIGDAHLLNKSIKNSKLEIIPGIGHAPNIEHPKKLAELINKFIK